jgi:hypothetical protein
MYTRLSVIIVTQEVTKETPKKIFSRCKHTIDDLPDHDEQESHLQMGDESSRSESQTELSQEISYHSNEGTRWKLLLQELGSEITAGSS